MDQADLRIKSGITRGQPFQIEIDGTRVIAYPGETLATVLLAAGLRVFRHTMLSGEARSVFCGMGVCYDCLVTLNGHQNIRACSTLAQPGDRVERQI